MVFLALDNPTVHLASLVKTWLADYIDVIGAFLPSHGPGLQPDERLNLYLSITRQTPRSSKSQLKEAIGYLP